MTKSFLPLGERESFVSNGLQKEVSSSNCTFHLIFLLELDSESFLKHFRILEGASTGRFDNGFPALCAQVKAFLLYKL